MDLPDEVDRLRLDLLAVSLCRRLADAGVPHLLLKGPSTANWLYHPPRVYRDVDLLVPRSAITAAVGALNGLATARSGRVGEEASHALLLHDADGYEVDLHITLPTLPTSETDDVWAALARHLEPMTLDVGTVPVLDLAGRCVVIALHALGSGSGNTRTLDDLRRARAATGSKVWVEAAALADQLGAADLFAAGIARVEPGFEPSGSRARLLIAGAPGGAHGLLRLSELPRRRLPRAIWQELFPSRGFMAYGAGPPLRGIALARAHAERWQRLAGELPAAVRAWRDSRR